MAQCPVCQADVNADFGLVECESCAAQLIIHVDGSVEHSGSSGELVAVYDEPEAPADPVDENAALFDEAPEVAEAAPLESEPLEEHQAPVAEFDGSEPEGFADSPGEVYRPPTTTDSPDLSDIAQFGNSEASSGREGALRYSVHVLGIDTSNIREEFREALTDRKFMWDVEQILRTIRNGEVRISNVSATKAYMLISRLRGMPVQVRWEQYAVHQT